MLERSIFRIQEKWCESDMVLRSPARNKTKKAPTSLSSHPGAAHLEPKRMSTAPCSREEEQFKESCPGKQEVCKSQSQKRHRKPTHNKKIHYFKASCFLGSAHLYLNLGLPSSFFPFKNPFPQSSIVPTFPSLTSCFPYYLLMSFFSDEL